MSRRTRKKVYSATLAVCIFMLFVFLSVGALAWGCASQETQKATLREIKPTDLDAEYCSESTEAYDMTDPTVVIYESTGPSQAPTGDTVLSTVHVHSYCVIDEVPPGCESNGYCVYVCSCGDDFREDVVPALGHNYTSTEVAPSCTEDGCVLYVCSDCGENYMEERTEALGHDYRYESTKPSTTTVAGYKLYRCANCGNTKRETLPLKASALGADMCGDSLLGKVLPHAANSGFASAALDYYVSYRTRADAIAAGFISIPADTDGRVALNDFLETYQYITSPFPYTLSYSTDDEMYLCWSSEEEQQMMQQVYARVYEILDELGIDETVTQKEAIARINNWICKQKYYEYNVELREYTTYHSLFGENGVCFNYAVEFQMLCLGAGIECHYYASDTMNHAWNKVYFSDGTYLWVDVCWNDTAGTSNYLLISTEALLKDHSL